MELRDIEIFLTLAEELHFGRTAERLHVSQARVSQAIKKQERRIGALLFVRTSRSVSLTPVGRRLRDDLQQGYDQIRAGIANATTAGHGMRGTLRLGFMGATVHEMRPAIQAFEERHPECTVELMEFYFSDPFALLRTGEVDMQLMWPPIRESDLTASPVVMTERRVLAVAVDDPLAVSGVASLEDFGDRVFVDPGSQAPDYWIEVVLPATTPGGRMVRRGPAARTFDEIMSLIAAGRIACPLNAHASRYYADRGIAYLPVVDAPLAEWVLVWSTIRENAKIRAFVDTACDLGRGGSMTSHFGPVTRQYSDGR